MKKLTVVLALMALPFLLGMGFRAGLWSPTVSAPTAKVGGILTTHVNVGDVVRLDVVATAGAGNLLQNYQWEFDDTTTDNPALYGNSFRDHVFTAPGHYQITCQVTDVGPTGGATFSPVLNLVVHYPLTAVKPTNSSTIILDPAPTNRIWVVNPDQDTVTTFSTSGALDLVEIKVGKNPRTLAQAADKSIWVVSQSHPSISIIDRTTRAITHVIPLPHGSSPYGICMTPDGTAAYVSFQGAGGVWKLSTSTRQLLATATQPPTARGIAVTADGRVFVTRFISPQSSSLEQFSTVTFEQQNRGEVVELSSSLAVVRTIPLRIDPGVPPGVNNDPDFGDNFPGPSANGSRGVPNYLTSLVVTPDGRRAWVPSKKDNIQRGQRTPERDGRTPGPEVAYRAIVSSIDLSINAEQPFERVDVDNSEMPQAACTSEFGDYIFIALQGTNRIQVRDLFAMGIPLNSVGEPSGTGLNADDSLAPQGLVIDHAAKKLYCQNYMGRTVAVFDIAPILNGTSTSIGAPVGVPVTTITAAEVMGNTVRDGKRVFYNAGDPRMSLNGYISCAGCHLDGGSDMRVLDFTNRGEGLRNTVMLQGRAGTGHGNVHWSANFDEIQDFDNDVFFQFHQNTGTQLSLTSPNLATAGSPNPSMGAPNAGRTVPLDAMAAYVASLDKVARSPFRNVDGTLSALGAQGEAVFKTMNCQKCHKGRNFTDSAVGNLAPVVDPVGVVPANTPILHDVGTIKASSGKRLGQPPGVGATLPGIDTPTLKGVWQTAPYLHDGSAATLKDLFHITGPNATKHFGVSDIPEADEDALVQYMIEIDEIDAPPVDPLLPAATLILGANASGRPYSFATAAAVGRLPFVDRSYTITTIPGGVTGGVLLRTAEDDKSSTAANQVQFTVPAGTNVFVYYDSRRTSLPTWLQTGWTALASPANDIVISPGLSMNAFQMNPAPAAGVVTLGGNQQGGPTGALRNYFVIITGAANFEEGPLSRGEWVHQQDGDGDGLRDDFEAVTSATVAGLSPWTANSVAAGVSDEDQVSGGATLFAAQPPPITMTPTGGGIVGGGGGGGGGCGLGGLEFLLPLLAVRLFSRRRK